MRELADHIRRERHLDRLKDASLRSTEKLLPDLLVGETLRRRVDLENDVTPRDGASAIHENVEASGRGYLAKRPDTNTLQLRRTEVRNLRGARTVRVLIGRCQNRRA